MPGKIYAENHKDDVKGRKVATEERAFITDIHISQAVDLPAR